MRIQPSALILWGWIAAAFCASPVRAQDFAAPNGGATADSAFMGLPAGPPAGGPLGSAYCPPGAAPGGYAGGYPVGAPPGAVNPWPQISPYDHVYDQTYREKDLWFNYAHNEQRSYFFSLEYLQARLRRPGTDLVGNPDPDIPIFDPDNPDSFSPISVGVFHEDIASHGLRGRFGIMNPDDTSFVGDVWWVGDSTKHFSPRRSSTDLRDRSTIQERAGVPLDDGAGGLTVPYDQGYDLWYGGDAWGASLGWVSTPFWGSGKGLKFRTIWGLKYLQVGEHFQFQGSDSGLAYIFDPATGLPEPGTIIDIGIPPYTSDLYSSTRSHLAGPEVGLRYELGGEALKFWGYTKLAVAANHEFVELHGNQIGDGFTNPFPLPTPTDPFPSDFYDSREHTHVSPIVETAIFAEIPVFQHLPVLKHFYLLENAKFRAGYNFVVANEMVRPTKVIQWKTPSPDIDMSRSRWTMGAFSFAVDWKF